MVSNKIIAFCNLVNPKSYENPNYEKDGESARSSKRIALAYAIQYEPPTIEKIIDQELRKVNNSLGMPLWEASNRAIDIYREAIKKIGDFSLKVHSEYEEEGKTFGYGRSVLKELIGELEKKGPTLGIDIDSNKRGVGVFMIINGGERTIFKDYHIEIAETTPKIQRIILKGLHKSFGSNDDESVRLSPEQIGLYFKKLFGLLSAY